MRLVYRLHGKSKKGITNFSPSFQPTRKRVLKLEARIGFRVGPEASPLLLVRGARSTRFPLAILEVEKEDEEVEGEASFSRYYDRLFSSVRILSSSSSSPLLNVPLSFSPSLSFEKFFREGRAAWNGGARSRWNGGKLISADEEKKIKIFTASVFSLEWPLRSWIIVTTQFRGGVNRILGWIGSWSGEWEGKERIDSRGWNSEMKQSERERKRGGWCGGGRKWRFCKRVRGISLVIWGREDRGGG